MARPARRPLARRGQRHGGDERIEALHVELATKLVVRESTAAVAVPISG